MAPLARTLALLAMTVATAAIETKTLDMAQDSFDDQYQSCGPAMTAALPALNNFEFQQNHLFAEAWQKAVATSQRRGPALYYLSNDQAIALIAYVMNADLYSKFNDAVRVAGRSRQEYRDKFHYKTLHFLLTQALVTLRDTQKGQCQDVFHQHCGVLFKAKRGDTVRFGQFMQIHVNKPNRECPVQTVFQVYTCHGGYLASYSEKPGDTNIVLIPPFETFEVTAVTQTGEKAQIQLRSTGTSSKYNCEWLQGGSVSITPFHLGGLLLATTALAVATGIL